MSYRALWVFDKALSLLILALVLTSAQPRLTGQTDRIRTYTRAIEFDYPSWVWDAFWLKIQQSTLNTPNTFDRSTNKQIVFDYLRVTEALIQTESRIEQIFADPNIKDKDAASALLRTQRDHLRQQQTTLAPFAEAVLQAQVASVFAEFGLTPGGQTIPPLLYHTSSTPYALIVSPRDRIEQTGNISLQPTITLDAQVKLEDTVASDLDVSTLVVRVGGIGVYPTMVMETTNLPWMISTIAHEWTHNYLNLRPLGLNYSTTPELRTMNETTANISGDEVGRRVLELYYPELLAPSPSRNLILFNPPAPPRSSSSQTGFDFRAEMRTTRVTADELLAAGKIAEAEAYMEQRRQLFWDNGYLIRKLNQAYFAFFGAYADAPGGAAGEDPVGPAVRALREQSPTFKDFIETIAWMTSFEQLQKAVHTP